MPTLMRCWESQWCRAPRPGSGLLEALLVQQDAQAGRFMLAFSLPSVTEAGESKLNGEQVLVCSSQQLILHIQA